MVVYGTEKVRQLCGYSTLAGAVKARLRYGGSTWKVRRTYGYNTVKYGKSTVLYGNFFFVPTVAM